MHLPVRHPWLQLTAAWATLILLGCYGLLVAMGGQPAGSAADTAPWPESADLSGVACAALALVAVGIWWSTLRRRPIDALPAAVAALAAVLLVRALAAAGAGTGEPDPQAPSPIGMFALALWVAGAALQLWCFARGHVAYAVVALAVAALQCMAVGTGWALALVVRMVFGTPPDSQLLASVPLLVLTSLLTIGLAACGWAGAWRSVRRGGHVYRWAFARGLALALACTVAAGLTGASVAALRATEALAEGLQSRALEQAEGLARYVQRTAHTIDLVLRHHDVVDARGHRIDAEPGAGDDHSIATALQALRGLGEPTVLAPPSAPEPHEGEPPRFAAERTVLVFETPAYRARLLPTLGLLLEYRGDPADRRLVLQLLIDRQAAPAPAVTHAQIPITRWLCDTSTASLMRPAATLQCTETAGNPVPGAGADAVWEQLEAGAPQPRQQGLRQGRGPTGSQSLFALAPIGERALLVTAVDARQLLYAAGTPLAGALAALVGLSLLAAAWSLWRQLPEMRRFYLALAQADVMVQHMPLATLLVRDDGTVLAANPAATRLLGRTAAALEGMPVTALLPDWRADAPQGVDRQCQVLDGTGAGIPVDCRAAHYEHDRRRAHVLMLRDLRGELRADAELQRWITVFHESGWGMAIWSAGTDSPTYELVNPAFGRLLGYAPADMVGLPVGQCVPAWHIRWLAEIREQVRGSGHFRGELRHRRRDGSDFPTLVDVAAVRGTDGTEQYYVVCAQDISELKHAEEAVQQSMSRLRAVLAALPVGLWIGDTEGTVHQTNPAAQLMWGADGTPPQAQAPADPWWQAPALRVPDHGSLLRRSAVTRARIDGGVADLPRPDGSRRAIMMTASPIVDDGGRTIGAVVVDEDITPMRQREAMLRQLGERMERILDSSAVCIAVCNADGSLARTNVAWNAVIGLAGERTADGRGAGVFERLLDPGDTLRDRQIIRRVCDEGLPSYVGEHLLRRITGGSGWVLLVVSRLPGASTKEPPQALVQAVDIDARRQAAERLASSEARLAAAQRMAGVGDWIWHVERDEFECSEMLLRILGVGPAPAGRLPGARLIERLHPEDRQRLLGDLHAAQLAMGRIDTDYRVRRDDGSIVEVHVQGVMHQQAAAPTMIGTVQDITERKRIERELRQSQERLRELVAYDERAVEDERKRIAREVHDELGQLLAALRMDLTMLRDLVPAESPPAARVRQMRETTTRMAEVVRHVASNLRPAALDLGLIAAIEWLAEDFAHRWELECQVVLPQGAEPVLPEPVALALFRAVQESLTNIAKHAQASRVTIALALQGRELGLSVTDDGCGFDVQATSAQLGRGLGLLGMRERMLAIGAILTIRSGPGGTTIDIRHRLEARPDDE